MKNISTTLFRTFILLLPALILFSCGGGGKSDQLVKDWKATELMLGETKLAAEDLGGVYFSFKSDNTFSYTESGKTDDGKWAAGEDGKTVMLTYNEGGRTVTQNIKEIADEKLVLEYEDHGMKRTVTLVPDKK